MTLNDVILTLCTTDCIIEPLRQQMYVDQNSQQTLKNDKSGLKTERNDKNNFFEFLTNLQKHDNILEQPIKVQ